MATLPSTGQQLPTPPAPPARATARVEGEPAAATPAPRVRGKAERELAAAFQGFSRAAGLLEQSYGELRDELARLRRELRRKNEDLARSLAETGRARARLEQVLAGLPCGVVVASGGRIESANPAAKSLLAPWTELEAGRPVPNCLAAAGGGSEEMTLEIGGEAEASVAARAATLAEGPRESAEADALYILRDTSPEKRREREREAGRNLRALAEMSALLAHEIRNPLAGMELFAGLLDQAMPPESEEKVWVEQMQAGLRMLGATVANVLDLHSEPPAQLAPLELRRFLAGVAEFLGPLARRRGARVEVETPPGALEVAADADRLRQALFNLAVNALRALPEEGGRLRFAARREANGAVALEVEDNGGGIAPEHLPDIFTAGFSTRAGGPGFGLAVCRRIAEQHGGEIAARSEMGRGTTMTLRLWRWGAKA